MDDDIDLNEDGEKMDDRYYERVDFQTADKFYSATLCKDLTAKWVMLLNYGGRKGQGGGSRRTVPLENFIEGKAMIEHIKKRRKKRGYIPSLQTLYDKPDLVADVTSVERRYNPF